MSREFNLSRKRPSSKDDFFESIKLEKSEASNHDKVLKKKSNSYKTHGFMIELEMYDNLTAYIDKRRMAGDTKYSQREALHEALLLLFKHKKVEKIGEYKVGDQSEEL